MLGWLFGNKSAAKGGTKTAKGPKPEKLSKVRLDRRFTILAEIGQGSMSKVYKAVDNDAGRTICLKVQDVKKAKAAAARTSGQGWLFEGQIAKKLVHPHIVRTYEYGISTKGEHFLVMEFIDGNSMNYVREARGLDLSAKLELLAQAGESLAAVHQAGYIHRDFGPKNLLIDREDAVKLIDFGLAVPNEPAFRRPGNRTGTLNYMAPELVRREPTDERIDIFSFGVTAFEFLTGRLPYDARPTDPMAVMRQRINGEPTPIGKVAPDLPEGLQRIIDFLLAKKADDRWQTADSLASELRAFA